MFGHQIADFHDRITKMNKGQETHPIKVNSRYEINGADSGFFLSSGNPIFA